MTLLSSLAAARTFVVAVLGLVICPMDHAKHKNIAKHQPSLINIELPCSFADIEMSDITTAISMSTDTPEILPLLPILQNRARGNRVHHTRVGRHAIELHP